MSGPRASANSAAVVRTPWLGVTTITGIRASYDLGDIGARGDALGDEDIWKVDGIVALGIDALGDLDLPGPQRDLDVLGAEQPCDRRAPRT